MKQGVKVFLIIILCMALFIGGIFGLVFFILGSQADANEYTLGSDKIPSIKAVVGKRNVTGTSVSIRNGVETHEIKYSSDSPTMDIEKYSKYLVQEAGFEADISNTTSEAYFGKESNDSGKTVYLRILKDGDGYVVTIKK